MQRLIKIDCYIKIYIFYYLIKTQKTIPVEILRREWQLRIYFLLFKKKQLFIAEKYFIDCINTDKQVLLQTCKSKKQDKQ